MVLLETHSAYRTTAIIFSTNTVYEIRTYFLLLIQILYTISMQLTYSRPAEITDVGGGSQLLKQKKL